MQLKLELRKLQEQIDKATTPFEVEKLQERLAKLVGGVAIIHVGGNTETEMSEKERIELMMHYMQLKLLLKRVLFLEVEPLYYMPLMVSKLIQLVLKL